MISAWIIANIHWLVPVVGWTISEIQGIRSGGKKASVAQILWDAFKAVAEFMGKKDNAQK